MAISFKEFNIAAQRVIEAQLPVLIRGRHGIGKSEVVYQIAKDIGMPVVERRASQMTEGDLLGMPSPEMVEVNGEQASVFRPFAWFLQACTEPVVLFFDEIDRAVLEVRQGLFELSGSRKLAGWTLHPETIIFAAINGGDHGAQYQVNEMDPAELDRWVPFDLEPTVEDWLNWGKDNVDPVVWDFINHNHAHLEHSDDFEPNKVYPSRRSWKRLSDCLVKAELLQEATPLLFNLSTAFVGFEAAVALNDFVKNYDRQVSIDDVMVHGKLDKVEKFDINDHNAFIEKLEASKRFEEKVSTDQLKNLADYFIDLPSECAMKLWLVISTPPALQDNVSAFHQAESTSGKRVCDHLVTLLTGKEATS